METRLEPWRDHASRKKVTCWVCVTCRFLYECPSHFHSDRILIEELYPHDKRTAGKRPPRSLNDTTLFYLIMPAISDWPILWNINDFRVLIERNFFFFNTLNIKPWSINICNERNFFIILFYNNLCTTAK